MAVTELLAQRRPHRADAARNFDAILAAARGAFTELGTDASLEEVARRAGVGIATLYRNFPTREELIEMVYVSEVDALVRYAEELKDTPPWDALVAWLRRFIEYGKTKRALIDALNRTSAAFKACREDMFGAGVPLLERAQQSGDARKDADFDDVLRLVIGLSAATFADDGQRERVFQLAIDGIRER
ncbi:helix-turn-helix domain-containing protein [Actinocrispum sp. NPDC049592]|uniref:TetR/AcrR family transcriptional regulator n=1 Tax=Actinocrispum sp. NPDC049592 TaxID=3154835 RepID=UPI003437DA99